MADTPLPKRDYNAPPPNNPASTATVPLVKPDATLHVNDAGRVVITPRCSEFESLRRTLYNALDKLDRLERRKLTAT